MIAGFYSEYMDELSQTMKNDMHSWVNLFEVDEKLVVLDDFQLGEIFRDILKNTYFELLVGVIFTVQVYI